MVDLSLPQPTSVKGRATMRRLMDAAKVLLATHGYAGVRVSDISAQAGLSNGAFYRYFVDKKQVLLLVIDEFLKETENGMRVAFDPTDPTASVHESTRRYFTHYRDNAAMFRAVVEAGQIDPDVEVIRMSSIDSWCHRISRMLGRGQLDGTVRADVDHQLMGDLLGGMLESYAQRAFRPGSGLTTDPESLANEVVSLWRQGVFSDATRG